MTRATISRSSMAQVASSPGSVDTAVDLASSTTPPPSKPTEMATSTTDWDNNRVQAWDPAGTFLWSLGQRGTQPGQLVAPSDVAIDEAGSLFVVDRTRVQVFDADHRVIGVWQRPDQGDPTLELGSIVVGKAWRTSHNHSRAGS